MAPAITCFLPFLGLLLPVLIPSVAADDIICDGYIPGQMQFGTNPNPPEKWYSFCTSPELGCYCTTGDTKPVCHGLMGYVGPCQHYCWCPKENVNPVNAVGEQANQNQQGTGSTLPQQQPAQLQQQPASQPSPQPGSGNAPNYNLEICGQSSDQQDCTGKPDQCHKSSDTCASARPDCTSCYCKANQITNPAPAIAWACVAIAVGSGGGKRSLPEPADFLAPEDKIGACNCTYASQACYDLPPGMVVHEELKRSLGVVDPGDEGKCCNHGTGEFEVGARIRGQGFMCAAPSA